MINPFQGVNWNPDLAARRTFAVSLIIGFPAIAAVLALIGRVKTHGSSASFLWLGLIGLGVGTLFWVLPQISKPFYVAWYFVACCIGMVMSNLLLAAFFYLAITPVALLLRTSGRQPLRKGFDRATSTYWSDAEKDMKASRYFRQF